MPTGVEYHRALLRLHAALAQWDRVDQLLRATHARSPDWSAVAKAHTRASDELHAAYEAVALQILAEIETAWSKGVTDAK